MEKKLNIKITANTANFKKTMSEASKKIKEFKDNAKGIKDVKFDNTTKGFKNIDKSAKNANKSLKDTGKSAKDTGKSLKDTANTKMNKLADQLKGTDKNTKELADSVKNMFNGFKALKSGNLSGVFKALKGSVSGASSSMASFVGIIGGVVIALKKLYDAGKKRFFDGLSNISKTLSPVAGVLGNLGSNIKSTFEAMSETSLSFQSLASAGMLFESQMNKVASISGAVGTELSDLTNKAKELGASTRYQAYEIGQAMEYMGMAGWSASDMLNGLDSVVNLAILSGTDLATASDIVTDDLTALGLEANQASDFVDKLAATITRSNTTVELYGNAMTQCGSQAGTLGIKVTDLNTAIGLMANAGKKGSSAGMSLKNLMANMASPTDKAEAALKKLGMTARTSGSYLKETADGNVDLAATCKALMSAMEGMNKAKKVSLLTDIAGKNAAPGVLAMLSQGEDAWNELSDSIDNSTQKVQYWNENMSIMGKSKDDARKTIEGFKDVFNETEESATALGLSTEDLAFSIQLLGADADVASENVQDLLSVFESMGDLTTDNAKKWRELGGEMANSSSEVVKNIKQGYDYNATLSKIASDTSGLTQATKEQIKAQLNSNMTYDQANKILEKYELSAERIEMSSLTTSDKIEYLRETMKGMNDETIKANLEALGLSGSFDEVKEVVGMSDKEFKAYQKNLKATESLAESMAKAMDADTVGSLKKLGAAIVGNAVSAFDKLKPAIRTVSDDLTKFFEVCESKGIYKALFGSEGDKGLVAKAKEWAKEIPKAIKGAIDGIKKFVTGGSLDGVLQIGTDIIQSICKGIINNKNSISTTIKALINKICNFIKTNKDAVKDAGLVILDAIGDGISGNARELQQACGGIFDVINAWTAKNKENMTNLGITLGTTLGAGFITGTIQEIGAKLYGGIKGIVNTVFGNEGDSKERVNTFSATADMREELNKNKEKKTQKKTAPKNTTTLKKEVDKQLKNHEITQSEADALNAAFDRSEAAKKGAFKTTKAYITELENRLKEGKISQTGFDATLSALTQIDKAKQSADKTSRAYYDTLQTSLMNGKISTEDVNKILASLDASATISKNASETGQKYLEALREKLLNGQISADEFNALVFAEDFESAAKKYTETGKITADDVIDASTFTDVKEVNDLRDALKSLNKQYEDSTQKITSSAKSMASSVRENLVNCANIVKNQCINMSGAFRTEFVNMSNIAKNQSQNMRNSATSSFISLRKVVFTQINQARNTVTEKMISIAKVVGTQAQKARNTATSSFISLRKVISTQMYESYNIVSSYMNKIAQATNRSFNTRVNVTKTINTVDGGNTTGPMALNLASIRPLVHNASLGHANSFAMAGINGNSGALASSEFGGKPAVFEINTVLDGKIVAKSTAKYMNGELSVLNSKNSRKRGY